MRSTSPNRTASLVRILATTSLLSVGTIGSLWATGTIELPFLSRKKVEQPEEQPPGTVAVPLTVQAIPAYTRLRREHFWDAKKGTFKVKYLKPKEVPPGAILNLNLAFNRVLAFDKSAGYALTEHELLPAGTRAGMVGGIPPGKRALVMEAAKLQGIYALRTGDHFDLLASVPLEARGASNERLPGASLVVQAQPAGPAPAKRASVEILAEDAILISAVTTRQVPVTTNSLTQGMRVTTKPVQEVVIALDPDEGTRVAEALAIDATVMAVARTGRKAGVADGPPGTVPVPVTAKAIPAYTRLRPEHFRESKKGTFSVVYLKPKEVPPGTILELNKAFGRVLAFDKSAGYALTEQELLPAGTRAGMVGGIPPGKRALVLEAAKLRGIYALRTGDHFDLLASVPVETRNASSGGLSGASLVVQAQPVGPTPVKRAAVEVLAEDAVLLSAVTTRQVPVTTNSQTQGMRMTTKPVQEVVIALDPEEGTRIAEALAIDATVMAVARTGRPGQTGEKKFPRPRKPVPTIVETVRGGKRARVVFQGEVGDEKAKAIAEKAKDGGDKPRRSPDSAPLASK